MTAMLLWTPPERGKHQKSVEIKEQMILHTRFLCVRILRGDRTPEAVLRRRVAAAAKKLKKRGAVRAVLPEEWPFSEQLGDLRPVSALPLRQAMAADWARWSLIRRGVPAAGARVAVCTDTLTGEAVRTVTELSLRHRYVLLDLPYGGEELCRQLRREYGVSVLLRPSPEELAAADAALLFAPRAEPPRTALPVYDETRPLPALSLPPVLEEQLPTGVNREQLLTVLRERGALREISIIGG